jgi:hypothetical protein
MFHHLLPACSHLYALNYAPKQYALNFQDNAAHFPTLCLPYSPYYAAIMLEVVCFFTLWVVLVIFPVRTAPGNRYTAARSMRSAPFYWCLLHVAARHRLHSASARLKGVCRSTMPAICEHAATLNYAGGIMLTLV